SSRMQALQDGVYLYLYNSSTAGDLAVVGDALVPGTGSTVHYSFTSSNVRGYTWNERGDLATVKVNATFSGSGTAVLPIFDTVRVHSASAGGAATDRWYAPYASNYVKLETHNTSGPAAYTHTWTNLTAYALVNPVVLVSVVLFPDTVGPGGPFEVRANTTAANAAIRLIIPAINFTATGSTATTGAFRLTVSAPAVNDRTPANTDVGSHGVLLEATYLFGHGFGV